MSLPLPPSPHLTAHPGPSHRHCSPGRLRGLLPGLPTPTRLTYPTLFSTKKPGQSFKHESNQVVPWPQDFHCPPSHCHHIGPQSTRGSVPSFPNSATPLSPAEQLHSHQLVWDLCLEGRSPGSTQNTHASAHAHTTPRHDTESPRHNLL